MKLVKKVSQALLCAGLLFSSSILYANEPATQAESASEATKVVLASDKVNINTATASELQRVLVGIGQKKAETIVEYREKNGPFTAAEQLLEVQGFGKATLDKNKDRILF
ncbi:ComEA family DNA-binding protein [Conservatibacter flavescens]|uniref:Competence protein ComE n=1 Tax=Conservatibacter flavescens TaxID=28161 RepID=A0A2M8S378_9PAST|nr:helix-hairpin-helix domain-containing protein [Conservatibacter flavescens]PJG85605.1 competence protein ComE [Conservatibacter flavescens]